MREIPLVTIEEALDLLPDSEYSIECELIYPWGSFSWVDCELVSQKTYENRKPAPADATGRMRLVRNNEVIAEIQKEN